MLRSSIFLVASLSATLVAMGQPTAVEACSHTQQLSQPLTHSSPDLHHTSFLNGGSLPIALGLGAGAITAAAVGVTLWQRRQHNHAPTPASDAVSLELPVVLPESEGAERSEDVTPIA
ncbi:hypothetical protein [Thermosynechococcus sp.]|uniref:hypothetical protein n=1 Tax=Thermosynechococcus sp. TaxID=2814275 RepID=UPI00391B913F